MLSKPKMGGFFSAIGGNMRNVAYHRIKVDELTCFGPNPFLTFLLCPICKYEYNHIGEVEKHHGKDSYQAWEGRGDLIKIFMECENGHRWNLCLGFHKGNTYIFCEHDKYWDGKNE